MKKGTVLVVLGLCLTFLVFGISRIRASADENDRIMSVVAPIQDLSMKTSQDLKVLNEMGIVIAPCEEDTLISEGQAKQIASEFSPLGSKAASEIVVEKVNLFDKTVLKFPDKAYEKNPTLKENGFVRNMPCYLVSMRGLKIAQHRKTNLYSKPQETLYFSEVVYVIDANSGEMLYNFSYR